jgi:hypothetical protein
LMSVYRVGVHILLLVAATRLSNGVHFDDESLGSKVIIYLVLTYQYMYLSL